MFNNIPGNKINQTMTNFVPRHRSCKTSWEIIKFLNNMKRKGKKKIRILYIRTFLRYGIIGYLVLLYFLAKNRTLKTEAGFLKWRCTTVSAIQS
jgi:hypothetical protein